MLQPRGGDPPGTHTQHRHAPGGESGGPCGTRRHPTVELAAKGHMKHTGKTALPDAQAVRRTLEGDTQAFAVLVERHQGPLFAYLGRHLPACEVAEAAQESFVQAFEKLEQLRSPEAFKPWLYAIASRWCIRHWRTGQGRRMLSLDAAQEQSATWLDDLLTADSRERFEDLSREREAKVLVARLMEDLKPEDRIALGLYYVQEHDTAEIAQMMGWSVEKVKVRMHRARKAMARKLDALTQEENK